MYIDTILFPIVTLGPGNRIVIWTKGCTKHCHNCANPELWEFDKNVSHSVNEISRIIKRICKNNSVDGLTITGGDPLEQKDEILQLIGEIKPIINDVLVYTGYSLQELDNLMTAEERKKLREYVSVLIDGVYIDALNDDKLTLRGSSNQNIYFFDNTKKTVYDQYILDGRKIQNVQMDI